LRVVEVEGAAHANNRGNVASGRTQEVNCLQHGLGFLFTEDNAGGLGSNWRDWRDWRDGAAHPFSGHNGARRVIWGNFEGLCHGSKSFRGAALLPALR
tara:strand:+ start:1076 stop:1369 length:294 start_codon:yes stop_codon:yes gene_type:complete